MTNGKEFLIGEGYPKESSVSSVGPQSVVGKIKNEIKSGNPVTWSWRGAGAFKKFAPKKAEVDKSEGNLSSEVAKREKKAAEKKGDTIACGHIHTSSLSCISTCAQCNVQVV